MTVSRFAEDFGGKFVIKFVESAIKKINRGRVKRDGDFDVRVQGVDVLNES